MAAFQDQDGHHIYVGDIMRIVRGRQFYGRLGRVFGYTSVGGIRLTLMRPRINPGDVLVPDGQVATVGHQRMVHDVPPPAPRQFTNVTTRIPGDVPADAPPRRQAAIEDRPAPPGQTIADAAAAAGTTTIVPMPTLPTFTDAPEVRIAAPGIDLAPVCAFVTETPYGKSSPIKFALAPRALAAVPVVATFYGYGTQTVVMGGVVRGTVAPGEGIAKVDYTQFLVELDDGTYRLFARSQLDIQDVPREIANMVAPSRDKLYVMKDDHRPPGKPESKIGMASSPEAACTQMRRGNPHIELYAQHLAQDAVRSERLAHHLCARYRVNQENEWFYMEPAHAELMVKRAIELINAALALKSFP